MSSSNSSGVWLIAQNLIYSPELKLDTLDSGLGDHRPVAALLGDGHHRRGGESSLPQDESHPQRLEEVLVLL